MKLCISVWYNIRYLKKYQESNQGCVTFWWRHHISRRSLKLSILINKSNSHNFKVYWKGFHRKVNLFVNPLDSNMTNIAKIYSLFQQKTYTNKNNWSWKSNEIAKSSLNFEKKTSRMLIPDKFQEKSPNCLKFGWITKKLKNKIY